MLHKFVSRIFPVHRPRYEGPLRVRTTIAPPGARRRRGAAQAFEHGRVLVDISQSPGLGTLVTLTVSRRVRSLISKAASAKRLRTAMTDRTRLLIFVLNVAIVVAVTVLLWRM